MRFLFVMLLLASAPVAKADPVIFTFPETSIKRGEVLQIPVKLAESGEFFGFQLAFTFDSTALRIENVTAGATTREWGDLVYAVPEAGRLSMSWFDAVPHPLNAAEVLFYIEISAQKDGRLRDWVVLQKSPLRPEIYDVAQKVHPVKLAFTTAATTATGSQPAGNFAVTNPQPNPTAAGTGIFWFLPVEGAVKFQLHDSTGKLISENEKMYPAGIHEYTVESEVISRAGTYIWTVWYGKERVSGTLIRL